MNRLASNGEIGEPCRGPLPPRHNGPVRHLHRRFQPPRDVQQDPPLAGAAVIVERAPDGVPGIDVIGFTTLAEHSRLCLAFPSTVGPGAQMYTKSRALQKVAIEDMAPLVAEVIGEAGIDLADIDYLIPHQTSARAIRQGMREFARRLGAQPKHVVVNLEEYGNTSSTTLFVALHKYLEEQRMHAGDRVMLLALASGIEIGIAVFTIDGQVDHYGHTH